MYTFIIFSCFIQFENFRFVYVLIMVIDKLKLKIIMKIVI